METLDNKNENRQTLDNPRTPFIERLLSFTGNFESKVAQERLAVNNNDEKVAINVLSPLLILVRSPQFEAVMGEEGKNIRIEVEKKEKLLSTPMALKSIARMFDEIQRKYGQPGS